MRIQNLQTRSNLEKRLKRIEGQVRGVQKMLEDDRQCSEIVQQLASIRSAVHSAMFNFVQEEVRECLFPAPGNAQAQDARLQEEVMHELIDLLDKIS